MKRLLAFLPLLLVAFQMFGANPSYDAFVGTNGIIITTNPPQGRVVVDGRLLTNSFVDVITNRYDTGNIFTNFGALIQSGDLRLLGVTGNTILEVDGMFNVQGTIDRFLANNFFAMNITNILAASGIAIGTNNGALYITNTASGSGADGVWTNDGFNIMPRAGYTNFSPLYIRSTDGSYMQGTNVRFFYNINDFETAWDVFGAYTVSNSPVFKYESGWSILDSAASAFYSQGALKGTAHKDDGRGELNIIVLTTNDHLHAWNMLSSPNGGSHFQFSTNANVLFEVDSSGDLITIKNVDYLWPSSQGAAGSVLTNDGTGVLGWGAGGGGGGVVGADGRIQYASNSLHQSSDNLSYSFSEGILRLEQSTANSPLVLTNEGTARSIRLSPTVLSVLPVNGNFNISLGSGIDWIFDDPSADFYPSLDGPSIGRPSQRIGGIWVTNVYGTHVSLSNVPGLSSPSLRIAQTNGRGFTEFTVTNSVISTNRLIFSFSSNSVVAGEVFRIHSTDISDGVNTMVITNYPHLITNFLQLSVQAAKMPATNYPSIDGGYQAWETVYAETNAEGSRVALDASWQFMVPPDYGTNSLKLLINYSLLQTNGPNTSNVVWGASVLVIRSGTTNNVHTNAFGSVVKGSNDWIAKYDGTNIVTNLVIDLGVNSLLMARDLAVIKLERRPTEDTYGGAVSVHGLQIEYTRP